MLNITRKSPATFVCFGLFCDSSARSLEVDIRGKPKPKPAALLLQY